ncbi:hypothetical protein QAD02_003885 [Eretmocerus hayati]|uniref:Uncharacterized protein n=1 Tax=Eretmocerus hayati TaxID=131215 RepID=A0ACC2NPU2_9HYME|nr:hypothetical protein QAD02_003885 [Eretmocerus hayati]
MEGASNGIPVAYSTIEIQTNKQNNQNQNQIRNKQRASYSTIAQTETLPPRDAAILIDAVDNLTIRDYALSIGNIIGPENMCSISRISQGRICIYMKAVNTAEYLVAQTKYVNINNHRLAIRPLNTQAKRILISNVHTVIPNSILAEIFDNYNVTLKSRVVRLKTGLQDEGPVVPPLQGDSSKTQTEISTENEANSSKAPVSELLAEVREEEATGPVVYTSMELGGSGLVLQDVQIDDSTTQVSATASKKRLPSTSASTGDVEEEAMSQTGDGDNHPPSLESAENWQHVIK